MTRRANLIAQPGFEFSTRNQDNAIAAEVGKAAVAHPFAESALAHAQSLCRLRGAKCQPRVEIRAFTGRTMPIVTPLVAYFRAPAGTPSCHWRGLDPGSGSAEGSLALPAWSRRNRAGT